MYLRILGRFKFAKNNCFRKAQIRKLQKIYGPLLANRQITTLRNVHKSKSNFSLQICGFAIFGTYLRTTRLLKFLTQ
jgi:hypothetical protein